MRFSRHPLTVPQKGHLKKIQKSAETRRAEAEALRKKCNDTVQQILLEAGIPKDVSEDSLKEAMASLPIWLWLNLRKSGFRENAEETKT